MVHFIQTGKSEEARLWIIAFTISLLTNFGLLMFFGISSVYLKNTRKLPAKPIPPVAQSVKIYPDMLKRLPKAAPKPESLAPSQVVRTSPDQESAQEPASRRFIGERNTQATSDRAATSDEAMPSQSGRKPKPMEGLETTQSAHRDGRLDKPTFVPSLAQESAPPTPSEQAKGKPNPAPQDADETQTAARKVLYDGPKPIDTPIPASPIQDKAKPQKSTVAREGSKLGKEEKTTEKKTLPKPTKRPSHVDDPAFSGYQTKTAIQGNISRTGRSALNVANTPMGRYQSQISRAVELEWQRNCVKHRDFITPGFLTVRFFVSADGRVKNVQFLSESDTGQIQKGFTLNAIRDAPIPAMPPAIKKEMNGDSLELIFNFYF